MADNNSIAGNHKSAAIALYDALDTDKIGMAILHQKALLDMMGVYFDAVQKGGCDTLPNDTLSSYVSQIREISNLIGEEVSAAVDSALKAWELVIS